MSNNQVDIERLGRFVRNERERHGLAFRAIAAEIRAAHEGTFPSPVPVKWKEEWDKLSGASHMLGKIMCFWPTGYFKED